METLAEIQQALKAPKGQVNAFGKYKYRSCEDILTAVKPLLGKWELIVTDEIVLIGDRYYVKATASISSHMVEIIDDKPRHIYPVHSAVGYAREGDNKKGMDPAQLTGATSSYARKYALNGLFAIDDTKDADTMDNSKAEPKSKLDSVLKEIARVKKDDEPSLIDFMNEKGLTGKDVLELNDKGLADLLNDMKKVFN